MSRSAPVRRSFCCAWSYALSDHFAPLYLCPDISCCDSNCSLECLKRCWPAFSFVASDVTFIFCLFVFFATLNLRDASSTLLTLSARPSDAIALALRTKSNILATSELLDQVGIEIPDQGGVEGGTGEESQELERFREFLEQINPDDFAG